MTNDQKTNMLPPLESSGGKLEGKASPPKRSGRAKKTAFSEVAQKRFWTKVDKSGECWEWLAGKSPLGYGHFKDAGKTYRAHRYIYESQIGPIADGLCVCHRCDNPGCVRPDHLWLGTSPENTADKMSKNRHKVVSGDMHYLRRNPELQWLHRNPEKATRGEKHPSSKLTESQVIEIRSLAQSLSTRTLAEAFSVCPANIKSILKRKTWAHI